MTVTVNKSVAFGKITAPPSKSMAHRYLICAALSEKSKVNNITLSEDIKATIGALRALGADIEIDKASVSVGGLDFNKEITQELFCNESGSTLRFLIPICWLFDREITLTGSKRLLARNFSVFEEISKESGFKFLKTENSITVKGKLQAGKYKVRGDVSSQFISGLMMALATLKSQSIIEITSALESGSYLKLTASALKSFGIDVSFLSEKEILINPKSGFLSREINNEADYSNAAFLDAFNYLGGSVKVLGLDQNSMQGDKVYRKLFNLISHSAPEIDISDCPDLGPVLMALAAAKNGVSLTGTKRLKLKESDRGSAMKSELSKFGIKTIINENEIIIEKGILKKPNEPLFAHNDHRILMSLVILLTLTSGEIKGAECVNKSYPNFFEDICSLGIDLASQSN